MNGWIDGYDLFWWSFSVNPAVCQTLTCVIGWLDSCAHKRLIVLPAGGCKHAKELIRWLHADGAQTFPRPSSPQHISCTSIYLERTHNHLIGTRLSNTSINAITLAWGDVRGDSKKRLRVFLQFQLSPERSVSIRSEVWIQSSCAAPRTVRGYGCSVATPRCYDVSSHQWRFTFPSLALTSSLPLAVMAASTAVATEINPTNYRTSTVMLFGTRREKTLTLLRFFSCGLFPSGIATSNHPIIHSRVNHIPDDVV